jgi:hypothetical protein
MKKGIIILFFLLSNNAFGQTTENYSGYEDIYTTGSIDTLYHNDSEFLFFRGLCNGIEGWSKFSIISEPDTFLRFAFCAIDFYDFCQQKLDTSLACIFRDIDNDRVDEMVIDVYWGGQACCHDIYFCSLSNPPKIRSKVGVRGPIVQVADLDGDSIPEIKFGEYKAGLSNYYCPNQIWKWDGNSLQLANYKFSDLILKDTLEFVPGLKEAMAKPDSSYDPKRWDNDYPTSAFKALLDIYAYGGRPDMIDSLFDEYWPSYNPGKEDYHKKVIYELGINDLLNQLKKSDW